MRKIHILELTASLIFSFLLLLNYQVTQFGILTFCFFTFVWTQEGLNPLRFLAMTMFLISLILSGFSSIKALLFLMNILPFSLQLAMLLIHGDQALASIQPSGPYKVGFKEFYTKKKGNAVSVLYPIDQDEYQSKISKLTDPKWLPYGNDNIQGIYNVYAKANRLPFCPLFLNSELLTKRMDSVRDGNLSKDFASSNSLIPIVFSHGCGSARWDYTAFQKELVSYGYAVFAMDHTDGSASGTKLQDGKILSRDPDDGLFNYDLRKEGIKIREQDFRAVLDELWDEDSLAKKLFGTDIRVFNTEKLVACGHSFGGATSVAAALNDNRIKALALLDPWFYPIKDELKHLKPCLNIPEITQVTETFDEGYSCPQQGFSIKTTLEEFAKLNQHGNKKLYSIPKIWHGEQSDVSCLYPVTTYLFELKLPFSNASKEYLNHATRIVDYLREVKHY